MTEEKKETGKTESAPAPVIPPTVADFVDMERRIKRIEEALELMAPKLLAAEAFIKQTEAAARAMMGGKGMLPKFLRG